jgi:hypothetical protein
MHHIRVFLFAVLPVFFYLFELFFGFLGVSGLYDRILHILHQHIISLYHIPNPLLIFIERLQLFNHVPLYGRPGLYIGDDRGAKHVEFGHGHAVGREKVQRTSSIHHWHVFFAFFVGRNIAFQHEVLHLFVHIIYGKARRERIILRNTVPAGHRVEAMSQRPKVNIVDGLPGNPPPKKGEKTQKD